MNDAVKAKPSRVGILTPKAKTREQIRRALICLRCATFVFDELDELWRMGPRGLDIFIVDASLCEDASVLKWLRDLRLRLGSATQMVLLYTTTRFEGEKPDRVANLVVADTMHFSDIVGKVDAIPNLNPNRWRPVFERGCYTLAPLEKTLYVDGAGLSVTATEMDILFELFYREGRETSMGALRKTIPSKRSVKLEWTQETLRHWLKYAAGTLLSLDSTQWQLKLPGDAVVLSRPKPLRPAIQLEQHKLNFVKGEYPHESQIFP